MHYVITITEVTVDGIPGITQIERQIYSQTLDDIKGPEGIKKLISRINTEPNYDISRCTTTALED